MYYASKDWWTTFSSEQTVWQLTWEPSVAASIGLKVNTAGMKAEEEEEDAQTSTQTTSWASEGTKIKS